VLLGEVIAKKTGLSYVDFVNERLFEAVGMPKQQLLSVDMNGADEEE
jgi:CubicO group peptidase (beta-lactamase class C family)